MAIVGCGAIARAVHLGALGRDDRVALLAVADPDAEALAVAQGLVPAARPYRDPVEAIEHPGVTAVVVTSSSDTHAELGGAVLARRLHLYLEKPIAVRSEEAERLVEAAEAAGVVAVTGLNRRSTPSTPSTRSCRVRRAETCERLDAVPQPLPDVPPRSSRVPPQRVLLT